MKRVLQKLMEKSKEWGVMLNPPATDKELKLLRNGMKQEPPKDIIDFYICCNGFETLDRLFRILPIDEILNYKNEINSSFCFAEYMIYSDEWTVNIMNSTQYSITNSNHNSEHTVTLSNSIVEFIERYANGGLFGENGLYAWFEENKLNSESKH